MYVRFSPFAWDHPRICGEHSFHRNYRCCAAGSSPHMRGTPVTDYRGATYHGIIPAYAGNTTTSCSTCRLSWDHPRICGEHSHRLRAEKHARGSSPHMRGTPSMLTILGFPFGIIPAYAGNTLRRERGRPHPRDHPRICGEHYNATAIHELTSGSSPHMRGTH